MAVKTDRKDARGIAELMRVGWFAPLLPRSREGTHWQPILQTLVCYRLIDPGSEWRLHRQWFERSAMACYSRDKRATASR